MFPSSQDPTQGGGDLEQRLRGLILNNGMTVVSPDSSAGRVASLNTAVPPHMLSASTTDQQTYLAAHNTQPESNQLSKAQEQTSQPGKRRLNQAQRRQMNSNLHIPIDPRPNPAIQSGHGGNSYSGNTQPLRVPPQYGYSHPQHDQRYQNHHQQQYSPRFPNHGQPSPYTLHGKAPTQSPHYSSPIHPQQHKKGANFYQQQQHRSPGFHGPESSYGNPPPQNRQLFQTGGYGGQNVGRPFGQNPEEILIQSTYLTKLLQEYAPTVSIDDVEEVAKDTFRALVEQACRDSIAHYEQGELSNSKFDASTVELKCFGSMSSGFATKSSDMDLALLSPLSNPAPHSSDSPIPRLLEKKLLDLGYGARLLTRTRVPIIKLCQKPTKKLLSDLLVERRKWEKGFITEPTNEEGALIKAKTSDEDAESPKETDFPNREIHAAEPILQTSSIVDDDHLTELKQKEHQSLGDYYISAKRLLRKLGGRDITTNSSNLTEKEGKILNDVCKSFVSGLQSEILVARLCSYQSISPLFDPSLLVVQRTLGGIWTQIEGERLAMAFENRPLTEAEDQREYECLNMVETWRSLQDECGPMTDALWYNRQLFLAAEKLKHISSLQLVFLEQMQYEEPIYYQKRAQRIMDDLKGRGQQNSPTVTPIVITHYIAGIYNPQIREALQKHSMKEPSLNEVGLRHRALQLAVDYEHAVKKDFFDKADQTVVEQYVALLRNPTTRLGSTTDAHRALVKQMHALPDPTEISLCKSKDRYYDHLEFPKTDIGIQCDINFTADLALHNTLLLRCYSHSDPRVKLVILFIKHWAKVRGINTPYRGSLSSYGYVLMVLHYLVNIAQPFVCPNLQLLHRDPPGYLPPAEIEARTICNGRDVRFWRNEVEIKDLANRGLLNHNKDSVGHLLRGFFEYFAHGGQMSTVRNRGFDWGREVLSLRTPGGILTKQEKGWVGAKTVTETTTISAPITPSIPVQSKTSAEGNSATAEETQTRPLKSKTVEETKEIRHRYLFAIEDPFELDHNVARTVTHNGIVSIRDEFRRAWRIIKDIGKANMTGSSTGAKLESEGLLDPVVNEEAKEGLQELLDLIHGPVLQT